ncbi:hypothetical protein QBC37DRAFT_411429 [Rhypophila decipiens]|uniref:Uncharacterized protein n=1 Tax=Rhypophila decipiens TaxID=261697 RepID=A0AAN6YHG2_9PEZI|nr:hypothetical protein QBC37DRAFT_411429 [Rhypophila decipiens]
MPGLTIATGGTPVAGATGSGTGSHPPQPLNPQPHAGRRGSRASRAASPSRPPVSPITPTLGPTHLPGAAPATSSISPLTAGNNNNNTIPNFAQGRPVFTHSQPDQVAISQLPPAQPISFDDNPDVLALKSAISILQLQRARAQADMQALNQAKAAALADPAAFIADLTEGRVSMDGDPLMSGQSRRAAAQADQDQDESSSSSSSSSSEDEDEEGDSSMTNTKTKNKPQAKAKSPQRKNSKPKPKTTTPWQKLPKPQTVVRMPPINWSQYGVVGESLDKLHAGQLVAPASGTPLPLGPGGTFEFKAATEQMVRDERQQQIQQQQQHHQTFQFQLPPLKGGPSIAAPYTPGRDKILVVEKAQDKEKEKEKKGKAGKR